jgi:hypothetical protein
LKYAVGTVSSSELINTSDLLVSIFIAVLRHNYMYNVAGRCSPLDVKDGQTEPSLCVERSDCRISRPKLKFKSTLLDGSRGLLSRLLVLLIRFANRQLGRVT